MKSNKESLGGTAEERKDRSSYNELPETTEESSPSKAAKKESRKGKENRELRILRRSKTLKEKHDPDRFSGDGINFKAKIIGTEHVFDARGNRMCQGALQRLKAAVKTSGDHKQRIVLNISLKGIIIKDEKSGEILHHHPIHKISFISQDVSDNRAFGYVFGCPQTGHEFFGIKTEKIASQVVFTLRDLFLTALEIKKKEIENAMGSQKGEAPEEESVDKIVANGVDNAVASNGAASISNGYNKEQGLREELLYSNVVSIPDEQEVESEKGDNASHPEPAVDTLLDLQFSMDSLQQGISQMDHSIASAATQQFGISFSEDDVSESSSSSLAMAFHFKLDKLSSLYQETLSISSRSSSTSDYTVGASENKIEEMETPKRDLSTSLSSANSEQNVGAETSPVASCSQQQAPASVPVSVPDPVEDKYAVFHDIDQLPSIFDNPDLVKVAVVESSFSMEDSCSSEVCEEVQSEVKTSTPIVFAELDPLGNHPYVDKKDFFQDLKTPPKKVLKDLVSSSELFPSSINNSSELFPASMNSLGAVSNPEDGRAEVFQHSSENSGTEVPIASETNGLGQNQEFNPFVCSSNTSAPRIPPKLPPKRSGSLANAFAPLSDVSDPVAEDSQWELRNPFNPFVISDYPDVPPPSSPPPPPPPRLPTKVSNEILSIMSTPPPRPPSRSNGVPTPPLPKRRSSPFAAASQTWFSFDQEALSLQSAAASAPSEPAFDQFAPPIPSPARKFPPMPKIEPPLLMKSSSASNSPATARRLANQSPQFLNSEDTIEQLKPITVKGGSPRKILSRHSSLMQESEAFSSVPFPPTVPPPEQPQQQLPSDLVRNSRSSPPLPPKPMSISRPRPSPSKKLLASAFASSSVSSSYPSGAESSNGTHSSSSLVFSSSDDGLMGSSGEPFFMKSGEHSSDVFSSQSSLDNKTRQSSRSSPPARDPSTCELSPDSIFRRKSDPFADEFFMTLPKKSQKWIAKSSVAGDATEKRNYSNGVEVCFEDLKTPT